MGVRANAFRILKDKGMGRMKGKELDTVLLEFAVDHLPTLIETITMTTKESTIMKTNEQTDTMTYAKLCEKKQWDVFDKGNEAKILLFIEMGWLARTDVGEQDKAKVVQNNLPESAQYKYHELSESVVKTDRREEGNNYEVKRDFKDMEEATASAKRKGVWAKISKETLKTAFGTTEKTEEPFVAT